MLLLVVGLAVSQLAAYARRLKAVTITDAGYLARVVDSAAATQSAVSPDAVVEHVRKQLISLLELRDCRFEYGMLLGEPPRLEQDGTLWTRYGHWPVDDVGLPDEEAELRAVGNGQYRGRYMLTPVPGSRPPLQVGLVAVTSPTWQDARSPRRRPPPRRAERAGTRRQARPAARLRELFQAPRSCTRHEL